MSTCIISAGEKVRDVKNLGWLLRNWQSVESFSFYYAPNRKDVCDGVLSARLYDGRFYRTDFASLTICWGFLRRPVFDGLKLTVYIGTLETAHSASPIDCQTWEIGSPIYREILNMKAEYSPQTNSYDNAGLYRAQLRRMLGQ